MVAADTVNRFNDKYYGQWLALHVPLRKLADLAVIEGDPLTDLRQSEQVRWTIVNGAVYEAKTMAQLHPIQRPAPRHFFQRSGLGEDEETAAQGHCGCSP